MSTTNTIGTSPAPVLLAKTETKNEQPESGFNVERAKELILSKRASYDSMMGWMISPMEHDDAERFSVTEEHAATLDRAQSELNADRLRAQSQDKVG